MGVAELSDRSEGVRDADAEPAVPGARRPLPVGRPPPHTRAHACTHARRAPTHALAHTRRAPTHTCAHALKLAIRPAVPRLTRVHTRKCSLCPDSHACTHSHTHWAPTRTCAHTRILAVPRLTRVHTRARMQGPAPAACRPLERCAPGLGRAWSRVPILPPGSRPRTCGTWPSPTLHPASSPPGAGQLLPSGLCAPRSRAVWGRLCRRSLQVPPHRAPGSRFPLALSPERPGLPRLLRLGFGRLWFFSC